MQRITIEIENNSDLQLLLLLTQRIGLKLITSFTPPMAAKERENLLEIIAKGGNMSYIENPMEWQREQRKDRSLPFRD